MSKPFAVSAADFQADVLGADKPVLVDFWATWCGPCLAIAPVLEELAEAFDGRLSVAKVDLDANPDLAVEYGVRSIPTLMLFKGGQLVDTHIGLAGRNQLEAFITPHLG